jgi:tRNA(Ile2) C34 agmatinyltransferase TiaS
MSERCAFCGAEGGRVKRARLEDGRMRCVALSGCTKRMRERVGVRVVLLDHRVDPQRAATLEAERAAREVRNARYRADLCIDCGVTRHSAGRPRCEGCHVKLIAYRALGYG